MALTNDLNDLGFENSKLFLYEKEGIVELKKYENDESPFLYDTISGNFHILPALDNENIDEIIKFTLKKRDEIKESIKKKIKENPEKYKDIKINSYAGNRERISKNTGTNSGKIFLYIRVEKKDIPYDLMFIRFFVDETDKNDKTVNCILKSFQFCKGAVLHSYLAYPITAEPKAKKSVEFMYYNPEVTFDALPDKVAECFLEFVEDN